ncbi:hypothetical protein VIBNIPon4_930024 [Vibrio nigripulchritudo POn4]|nr:hypothetical protein VIBNIPon4_930024 [Vibrio nigripulchritudo POn4]
MYLVPPGTTGSQLIFEAMGSLVSASLTFTLFNLIFFILPILFSFEFNA